MVNISIVMALMMPPTIVLTFEPPLLDVRVVLAIGVEVLKVPTNTPGWSSGLSKEERWKEAKSQREGSYHQQPAL